MQRLALSQLKTQPRRYVSLVLAILIGTAFLAASFLVGASSQATMTHSMGSAYANADLVVLPDDEAAIPDEGASEQDLPASMRLPQLAGTPAAPGPIGAVDGVAEAYAGTQEYVEIGPKGEGGMLLPMPQHTELTGVEAQAGRFPAWDADDEVALDAATAERLDVQVGDELRVGRPGGETVTARVVGLSAQTAARSRQVRGPHPPRTHPGFAEGVHGGDAAVSRAGGETLRHVVHGGAQEIGRQRSWWNGHDTRLAASTRARDRHASARGHGPRVRRLCRIQTVPPTNH